MNLQDAKLFAEELVQLAEKKEFYGLKHSVPAERTLNLARCFLRLNDPVCCHAQTQCEVCPMKRYDIPAVTWLNPLAGGAMTTIPQEKRGPKPGTKVVGRKGRPITIDGVTYKSTAEACRLMGVHKSVINRMLRDANSAGS